MLYCQSCDRRNPDDARFCVHCGAALRPVAIAQAPAYAAAQPTNINVTVMAPQSVPAVVPQVMMDQQNSLAQLVLRAVYFVFIGLWLGAFWTVLAWLLTISIIFLPFGIWMLNRLPQVMTLKPMRSQISMRWQNGVWVLEQHAVPQHAFVLRAVYFVLVGWWLSALWLFAAWALTGITLGLGLPLAFWMFDQTPALVTLARQ